MALLDLAERLGGGAKGAQRKRERRSGPIDVNLCEGCTACCVLPQISALNKPAGQRCVHCNENGCGIYHNLFVNTRPEVCARFKCIARRHQISDWNPRRCGIMITTSRRYLERAEVSIPIAFLWETRKGAFEGRVVDEMRVHFFNKTPPFVVALRTISRRTEPLLSHELLFPPGIYSDSERHELHMLYPNRLL